MSGTASTASSNSRGRARLSDSVEGAPSCEFDLAITFDGPQRPIAEQINDFVTREGLSRDLRRLPGTALGQRHFRPVRRDLPFEVALVPHDHLAGLRLADVDQPQGAEPLAAELRCMAVAPSKDNEQVRPADDELGIQIAWGSLVDPHLRGFDAGGHCRFAAAIRDAQQN